MKTFIAVPSMDLAPMLFADSLAMLEKEGETVLGNERSSLIYSARNNLAAMAVDREADRILWLDSDMVFPSGTLRHMSKVLDELGNKVILTGAYFRRTPPYSPVLYKKLDFDEKGNAIWEDVTEVPNEIFEVEACGFGCVLAPTAAFVEVSHEFGEIFGPIHGTGEDLSFCWRARQLGYKIFCDPRINLGHVTQMMITRKDWEYYRAVKEAQKNDIDTTGDQSASLIQNQTFAENRH